MDKIKEGTSLSIVFADWCEMTGVSPSLFCAVWELFKDKTDKGGNPYISHLIQVAQNVKPQFARIAKNPLWLNFVIAVLMLILWGIAIFALGVTTSVLFHLMIGV